MVNLPRTRRASLLWFALAVVFGATAAGAAWKLPGWSIPRPGWTGTEQAGWVAGIVSSALSLISVVIGALGLRATRSSSLTSSTVLNLGGSGGAAQGAAGGGGGAIGSGAVGGPGGSVGRIELNGADAKEAGAGGGGGGVVDHSSITWTEEELQRNTVGSGGVYGMDGQQGGATSFGNLIVAPGGSPGLTGSGIRLRDKGLHISTLLLGEHFHVRDGLAFVIAGGFSQISWLNLPVSCSLGMLVVFEAGGIRVGDYTVRVEVRGPANELGGAINFPVTVDRSGPTVRIPIPLSVLVNWTSYGKWEVIVSSDVQEIARQSIIVKRTN
jgi:hypothetical protein